MADTAQLEQFNEEVIGLPVYRAGPETAPLIGVPELPPHYLPRPDDLTVLKLTLLSYANKVAITSTTLLSRVQGMGGIGKSVLAAAIAWDDEVRRAFPDGIIWVSLGRKPTILVRQMQVARALGAYDHVYEHVQDAHNSLTKLLQDKVCMLILDDVCHLEHVQAFDVLGPRCRMLITTRDATLVRGMVSADHRLDVLSDDQALRLLALWAAQPFDTIPTSAYDVVRMCANLPMALSITGAMIRDNPNPWSSALHKLRHVDLEKLEHQFADSPYPGLLRAIHVSVDSLDVDTRKQYLSLAVFPKDTPIPVSVIQTFWNHEGLRDEETLDTLDMLIGRSLLQLDALERVSFHDLQFEYISKQAQDVPRFHAHLLDAYCQHIAALSGEPFTPASWALLPAHESYMWQYVSYHLIEAGMEEELYALLLDFAWMRAKLYATDVSNLILEYDCAIAHLTGPSAKAEKVHAKSGTTHGKAEKKATVDRGHLREVLLLVWNALRLSSQALARDKTQLAGQLIGRLLSYEKPEIQTLLQQSKALALYAMGADNTHPAQHWLCPCTASLAPPAASSLLLTLESLSESVLCVAMTPDNRCAVVASDDGSLSVWDVETERIIAVLEGDAHAVCAVALFADGKRVVSASTNTLKMWDVESKQVIACFDVDSPILNCGIAPDGVTIVVGDQSGRMHFLQHHSV